MFTKLEKSSLVRFSGTKASCTPEMLEVWLHLLHGCRALVVLSSTQTHINHNTQSSLPCVLYLCMVVTRHLSFDLLNHRDTPTLSSRAAYQCAPWCIHMLSSSNQADHNRINVLYLCAPAFGAIPTFSHLKPHESRPDKGIRVHNHHGR